MPLTNLAIFFDYVIVRSQRFYASLTTGNRASAIAEIERHTGGIGCAEILEIFQFQQCMNSPAMWLARIRWLQEWQGACEEIWGRL